MRSIDAFVHAGGLRGLLRGSLCGLSCGLLLAGLALSGCNRQVDEASWAISHRLIAEPTDLILDLDRVKKAHGYEIWNLGNPDEPRRWKTPEPSALSAEDGFLRVPPTGTGGSFVRLSREVDLLAENVSAVVVEVRGIQRGRLRLFWVGPGEIFIAERGAVVDVGRSTGEVATYRFELADHPLWQGKIRALRLDVPDIDGQVVELRSVSTVGEEGFESRMLAGLVAQDWKVSLGSEARNALLSPPGVPRTWTVPAPTRPASTSGVSTALRFAYGLPQGTGPAMTFRIIGADATTVFEDIVDPGSDPRAGQWLEATVDLASTVEELVFETVANGEDYVLEDGIPAWGHPEIVERSNSQQMPNVVLISIDTLRADRLGVYGYPQPTSPNIDRWAKTSGVVFKRAVTTAPWTLPSHVSMLSGLDALTHGVNHRQPAPLEIDMLPEILRREGYSTLGITGGGWLHPDKGLAQGFDVFRYWGQAQAAENEVSVGVDHASDSLSSAQRPFFLFFHTYEVHDPYRYRLPYASRCVAPEGEAGEVLYGAVEKKRQADSGFAVIYELRKWLPELSITDAEPAPEADLPLVNCLYDSGVAHADAAVGRLLDRLRELELDRNTLIVLTSDHGESLGEEGFVKHATLHDNNLLVPLIMALPNGDGAGSVVDAQVSTVDIVPTMLAVLGIETETTSRPVDGTSLLPLLLSTEVAGAREAWSYAGSTNYGVSLRVNDRLQYLFNNTAWQPLVARDQLFDLSLDAAERQDIAADSQRQVDGFRTRLTTLLQERSQGVRLNFDNRSCGTIEGMATGLAMHISRIKSEGLPDGGFVWIEPRRASFRVEPSQSFGVLMEAPRGPLTLAGTVTGCESGDPGPFRVTVDLDALEDSWTLAYDGSGWIEAAVDGDPEVEIRLRRRGTRTATVSAGEIDPALVEQLKALGYLNN